MEHSNKDSGGHGNKRMPEVIVEEPKEVACSADPNIRLDAKGSLSIGADCLRAHSPITTSRNGVCGAHFC